MLYMFAALAGPAPGGGSGMADMAGRFAGRDAKKLHAATLALIFALLLIAYTVRDLDRKAGVMDISTSSAGLSTPAGPALATAAAGGTARGAPAGGDSAVATMVPPDTAPAELPPGDPATGQVTASPVERLWPLPPWSRAAGWRWASRWRSCC